MRIKIPLFHSPFNHSSSPLSPCRNMTSLFHSDSRSPRATEFQSPLLNKHQDAEQKQQEEGNSDYFSSPSPSYSLLSSAGDRDSNRSPILGILASALRRSLVTCSVERAELEIGWPTDVRHTAHVTFDRFNGFLGLPVEFEPDVPKEVPSASTSVFGVSAKSMHCSYDNRGNSVPTILLLMQKLLYLQGGLQAEGIFRLNAENGEEEYARNQLNRGIVPHGIDLHCLAGLIKAWFRELPTGVLDSLTPGQLMHCHTEEECARLLESLPPTEAALLDWSINLMADVAQQEHHNKMNAHNIAMVFAPNMTQVTDPLIALIHAVQVMKFLKTLIIKTMRERDASEAKIQVLSSHSEPQGERWVPHSTGQTGQMHVGFADKSLDAYVHAVTVASELLEDGLETSSNQSFQSFPTEGDPDNWNKPIAKGSPSANHETGTLENGCRGGYSSVDVEGLLDRLSLRKRVRKLCRHPVFQLSKRVKKSGFVLEL